MLCSRQAVGDEAERPEAGAGGGQEGGLPAEPGHRRKAKQTHLLQTVSGPLQRASSGEAAPLASQSDASPVWTGSGVRPGEGDVGANSRLPLQSHAS